VVVRGYINEIGLCLDRRFNSDASTAVDAEAGEEVQLDVSRRTCAAQSVADHVTYYVLSVFARTRLDLHGAVNELTKQLNTGACTCWVATVGLHCQMSLYRLVRGRDGCN
jgi:hypothetical protein